MSIFVIADLHLSFRQNKPMSIFGENWKNHEEKIKKDWIKNVNDEDLVVLPGDFSWETYLDETYLDFKFIHDLPGKKILLKGNHDYWWSTVKKMNEFLERNKFHNIDFIYNNAFCFDRYILAGTRGWSQTEDGSDEKMLHRELLRFELSLSQAKKINENSNEKREIIAFMHYPPIINKIEADKNKFLELMKKYNVKKCFYGHLHATSINDAIEGNVNGIELKLISADKLDFKLYKID